MIEQLPVSHGALLGFEVTGEVTRSDYDVLVPAVQAKVDEFGSVRLMLDLHDFESEKAEAWGADLRFGHEYHDRIERLAIVGSERWQEWLTHLARPFYCREARFFESRTEAWVWLSS
ncbi:MAG: STAS/SEC14 domain-containing protein [Microthrixaceae bacterium]